MFARARLTSAVELYNRKRQSGQPLQSEPSRVHGKRTAAAGRRLLPVGGLRRAVADSVRRSGSSCTPNAASARLKTSAASVGRIVAASRRGRLSHAALHHLAEPVFRALPAQPERSLARSRARQRRARRDLRLGSRADLHLWPLRVADHRGALSAHLRSCAAAVLGNDCAPRGHLSGATSPTTAPASTPSVIRSSPCSTTWCTSPRSARSRAPRSCWCFWGRRSSTG